MKIFMIILPLAFLVYFWAASFFMFAGTAGAVTYWNVNATVNVTNQAPTVTNVVVDDDVASPPNQIDLTPGSTKLVYCNGTANDTNGYSDITTVSAVFYENVTATPASANNNETHYTNSSCSVSGGAGVSETAICAFQILYYANNQTWICNMTATDSDSATGTGIDGTTVNLLIGLNISNQILNYGDIAPDATSGSVTENVTNHGNTQIDLALNGTNMPCSGVGSINVERQHYNVTGTEQTYDSMVNLTGTQTTITNFNLAKRTDASGDSKRTSYWKIQAPLGTKGRCEGNVTFTALAG